jgi:hypothetical protein
VHYYPFKFITSRKRREHRDILASICEHHFVKGSDTIANRTGDVDIPRAVRGATHHLCHRSVERDVLMKLEVASVRFKVSRGLSTSKVRRSILGDLLKLHKQQ